MVLMAVRGLNNTKELSITVNPDMLTVLKLNAFVRICDIMFFIIKNCRFLPPGWLQSLIYHFFSSKRYRCNTLQYNSEESLNYFMGEKASTHNQSQLSKFSKIPVSLHLRTNKESWLDNLAIFSLS